MIQEILKVDNDMQDSNFSLVESYIGNALISKEAKNKGNKKGLGYEQPIDLINESEGPPVEIVLDFFFYCTDMSKEKIVKILIQCFKEDLPIDFEAVAHLLVKATKKYKDLVSRELLETYLKTKETQYDNKSDKIQVLWLQLLLDLFKCAANSGDPSVADDYNDQVISLLELKPQFTSYIRYDSEHEDEEEEEEEGTEGQSGEWGEQSELL